MSTAFHSGDCGEATHIAKKDRDRFSGSPNRIQVASRIIDQLLNYVAGNITFEGAPQR
jgi:hypothetical protein